MTKQKKKKPKQKLIMIKESMEQSVQGLFPYYVRFGETKNNLKKPKVIWIFDVCLLLKCEIT
jgi:hypothetical protein